MTEKFKFIHVSELKKNAEIVDAATKFQSIRNWAYARNLIEGATSAAQYEKLLEEVGELGRALIEGDDAKLVDAIGDCVVVLTILAEQNRHEIEDCIRSAYEEIKDRKGQMIDGKFVKEQK